MHLNKFNFLIYSLLIYINIFFINYKNLSAYSIDSYSSISNISLQKNQVSQYVPVSNILSLHTEVLPYLVPSLYDNNLNMFLYDYNTSTWINNFQALSLTYPSVYVSFYDMAYYYFPNLQVNDGFSNSSINFYHNVTEGENCSFSQDKQLFGVAELSAKLNELAFINQSFDKELLSGQNEIEANVFESNFEAIHNRGNEDLELKIFRPSSPEALKKLQKFMGENGGERSFVKVTGEDEKFSDVKSLVIKQDNQAIPLYGNRGVFESRSKKFLGKDDVAEDGGDEKERKANSRERNIATQYNFRKDSTVGHEDTRLLDTKKSRKSNSEQTKNQEKKSNGINVQLPSKGDGYISYEKSSHRWGKRKVIKDIIKIGRILADQDMKMSVGDISLKGGGRFFPHVSHEKGIDADFRLMAKDGIARRITMNSENYSKEKTIELMKIIIEVADNDIEFIFFDDKKVNSIINSWAKDNGYDVVVKKDKDSKHTNHFHVRWKE